MVSQFYIDGIQPRALTRPQGDWRAAPPGLARALKLAGRFVNRTRDNTLWFTRFVHLSGGRIYATNNTSAVELDPGDSNLPDAVFRTSELRAIAAFEANPSEVLFTSQFNAVAWSDGQWCLMRKHGSKMIDGTSDGVPKVRDFIETYWQEPAFTIANDWRKDVLWALRASVNGVARVASDKISVVWQGFQQESTSAEALVETDTHQESYWTATSLLTVLRYATAMDFDFDSDVKPASFALPNGRGLIVETSRRVAVL